jgi:hypothetical protein
MKKPHFVSKIPTHSSKDTTTQDYQDAYYVLTLDSMAMGIEVEGEWVVAVFRTEADAIRHQTILTKLYVVVMIGHNESSRRERYDDRRENQTPTKSIGVQGQSPGS